VEYKNYKKKLKHEKLKKTVLGKQLFINSVGSKKKSSDHKTKILKCGIKNM